MVSVRIPKDRRDLRGSCSVPEIRRFHYGGPSGVSHLTPTWYSRLPFPLWRVVHRILRLWCIDCLQARHEGYPLVER